MGATSGAENAYLSGAPNLTPQLFVGLVLFNLIE
jgi:hypothetical protein